MPDVSASFEILRCLISALRASVAMHPGRGRSHPDTFNKVSGPHRTGVDVLMSMEPAARWPGTLLREALPQVRQAGFTACEGNPRHMPLCVRVSRLGGRTRNWAIPDEVVADARASRRVPALPGVDAHELIASATSCARRGWKGAHPGRTYKSGRRLRVRGAGSDGAGPRGGAAAGGRCTGQL